MASHLGKVDLLFQGIRQLLQEVQLFRHDASACEQMSNIVLARGKGGTWHLAGWDCEATCRLLGSKSSKSNA
jgi:hypothetical protein